MNQTAIGRQSGSSPGSYFGGSLAEVGIWACALTDQEVAALATGVNPYRVRPASLVAYWPLFGTATVEPDYSGQGFTLTNTGSSPANHCPKALWTPRRVTNPAASGIALPEARIMRPIIYLPPLAAALLE